MNGTHSPTEQKKNTNRSRRNTSSNDSRSNRDRNADPDGIVKPRDLDPEPEGTETPEIVSNNPTPELESPEPAPSGDSPYAEAVPGMAGFVYSPFVANKKDGRVNVTDVNNVPLPPGTEVIDPHTGKTFRVP